MRARARAQSMVFLLQLNPRAPAQAPSAQVGKDGKPLKKRKVGRVERGKSSPLSANTPWRKQKRQTLRRIVRAARPHACPSLHAWPSAHAYRLRVYTRTHTHTHAQTTHTHTNVYARVRTHTHPSSTGPEIINAPIQKVYTVITDFDHYTDWSGDGIKRMKYVQVQG